MERIEEQVANAPVEVVRNGSACTSQSYQPSHVLKAMGLSLARVKGALRFSWCHMTPPVDWAAVVMAANRLRAIA